MAGTKRQKSDDAAERKRGQYKKARAPESELSTVTRKQWQAWVDEYTEGSPIEHEPTRRALAEGLATARRIVTDFAERATTSLTDGEARLLAKAMKEVRDTTKALALDKIDKARRKRRALAPAPTAEKEQVHAPNGGRSRAVARGKLDGQGRQSVEPSRPRVGEGEHAPAALRLEDL